MQSSNLNTEKSPQIGLSTPHSMLEEAINLSTAVSRLTEGIKALNTELSEKELENDEFYESVRYWAIANDIWKETALLFASGLMKGDIQIAIEERIKARYLEEAKEMRDVIFPDIPEA